MSETLGALCLVLHGHLPYVLNHGTAPHGEAWLYEAAAETYLPLLEMIGELAAHRTRPALTVGLTPVLLEQLCHDRFKAGFVSYLKERSERAARDRAEFERANQPHFAFLASRWEKWHQAKLDQFERIGRDIAGQFANYAREGHIQILTSAATHSYLPLLLNDQMIHAQLACGTSTSRKRLGLASQGVWLPECAYRPTVEDWMPAVLYDNPRHRRGLEYFVADAGLTHFFVDTHLVTLGEPLGIYENGNFRETSDPQLYWDQKRGWRSPLEAVGVASRPEPPRCFAFVRHPRVSEQVWSGVIGYPAAGEYLEFHRKHGEHGLRYHRVTHTTTPLGEKQSYAPDDTFTKLYDHSQHFCNIVRDALREYKERTGREGVVVAPFDAELFGHWWFEGPRFLRDVIYTLSRDKQVRLMTTDEALGAHVPDKVMRLPEGSWGENGNHGVWLNDRNRWMWEIEYRAEGRMLKLLHELPWRTNDAVREMMQRAARELLLLQASDWPFVLHNQSAADYAIQRFSGHATRFDRMLNIAQHITQGHATDAIQQTQIAEADAHDSIFQQIDLTWWM